MSGRGGIQVCNQRVQVGMTHARKIVTVEVDRTVFRILDFTGAVLTVVARTNTQDLTPAQDLRQQHHEKPNHGHRDDTVRTQ